MSNDDTNKIGVDYRRIRGASYLLPDPGGEVVRELLDELERLCKQRKLLVEHLPLYKELPEEVLIIIDEVDGRKTIVAVNEIEKCEPITSQQLTETKTTGAASGAAGSVSETRPDLEGKSSEP